MPCRGIKTFTSTCLAGKWGPAYDGIGKHAGLGLFLRREILQITGITIAETGGSGTGARFQRVVSAGGFRVSKSTGIP